jgi:hypothetical protein
MTVVNIRVRTTSSIVVRELCVQVESMRSGQQINQTFSRRQWCVGFPSKRLDVIKLLTVYFCTVNTECPPTQTQRETHIQR